MFNRSLAFLTNTKKFLKNTIKLGYDTCHRTHGYDASPCYRDCKKLEQHYFAKKCLNDGGLFKCCIRFGFMFEVAIWYLSLEETKNFVMIVDTAVLYLFAQPNMDQVSNLAMSQ